MKNKVSKPVKLSSAGHLNLETLRNLTDNYQLPSRAFIPLPEYVEDQILKRRYYLKGEPFEQYYERKPGKDEQENWDKLCLRVAGVVARGYNNQEAMRYMRRMFYDMLYHRDFLPNSPTLFGAGVPGLTLSACYVIEMTDSIDGWAETFHTAMKVQCAGGGCGFPLHKLRPHGSQVRGKNAKAAGPIEWMQCWNSISQTLRQAVRNGANMGLLRVDHPDIEAFISCKDSLSDLTNFNISVGITDKFIEALHSKNHSFDLVWDGEVTKTIDAKILWDKICAHAWKTGEPGLLFIDNMNRNNPYRLTVGDLYPNPCAEATLFENSACNLGSINLANFVTKSKKFDLKRFRHIISLAYLFLENLIDVNTYPTEKISQVVKSFRQIGLGLMGLADLFTTLGIRYGSPESIRLTEEIMQVFREKVDEVNTSLGNLVGSYPHASVNKHADITTRNFTTTCIAPTGTISQIAGCSAGIEPHFSFETMDRSIAGKRYLVPGPTRNPDCPAANVTIADVTNTEHIIILSTVQRYIDMAVSKTINLPNSATVEDVQEAYLACAKAGVKGVTVYRDGSRSDQTIITKESILTKDVPAATSTTSPAIVISNRNEHFGDIVPIPRPDPLVGMTHKYKIGCGSLYVTVNKDPIFSRPMEIFIRPGKFGGCTSNVEAIGRLASLALRCGVKLEELIKQLSGIRCVSCISKKHIHVTSCADAVGRAIKEQILAAKGGPVPTDTTFTETFSAAKPAHGSGCNSCITECGPTPTVTPKDEYVGAVGKNQCPECNATLRYYDGCVSCACGYSKCG